VCAPADLNWLTKNALGFGKGLLDLAEDLGIDQVHDIVTRYAAEHPGFEVPKSIAAKKLTSFRRNVTIDRDNDVAVVTIRRPEVKNALNEQTIAELTEAFAELDKDSAVKCIVLTSFDGSIAGADIMELAALDSAEAAEQKCLRGQGALAKIAALTKPVVAAVDGPILGGGCELTMACHARVVGPNLMLGQPEVNLGIIPGYGGTQRLPRLIGVERGADLLRTGRPVGAKDACAWGWAHGEPAIDFIGAAKALVKKHVAGEVKLTPVNPEPIPTPIELPVDNNGHRSPAVATLPAEAIRDGLKQPLAEGLKVEAAAFARCRQTIDYGVGMTNFIQNGPRVPAEFLHE